MEQIDLPVKQDIAPGSHTGRITEVFLKRSPYNYLCLKILTEGITVAVDFPADISKKSSLGRLLMRFGVVLQNYKNINPSEFLLDKEVEFNSVMDGKFYRAEKESIKLLQSASSLLINPEVATAPNSILSAFSTGKNGNTIMYGALLEMTGLPAPDLDDALERLLRSGEIFEPRRGYYQKI